jgi:hypothetical protein
VDLQEKTVRASERDEEARARWRERVRLLEPGRPVFVDECGTNVGLAPLRARAPRVSGPRGLTPAAIFCAAVKFEPSPARRDATRL